MHACMHIAIFFVLHRIAISLNMHIYVDHNDDDDIDAHEVERKIGKTINRRRRKKISACINEKISNKSNYFFHFNITNMHAKPSVHTHTHHYIIKYMHTFFCYSAHQTIFFSLHIFIYLNII